MAASALLAQLVEHLHGKEGVDGSSPSEGLAPSLNCGLPRFITRAPMRPLCVHCSRAERLRKGGGGRIIGDSWTTRKA
jgi:hypothetical protein